MEDRLVIKERIIGDDVLDVVGLCCPMPLALTMERIKELNNDDVLEVLLDDEEAILDIPKWCKKDGHRFLRLEKEKGIYKLYIRKGDADGHRNKG